MSIKNKSELINNKNDIMQSLEEIKAKISDDNIPDIYVLDKAIKFIEAISDSNINLQDDLRISNNNLYSHDNELMLQREKNQDIQSSLNGIRNNNHIMAYCYHKIKNINPIIRWIFGINHIFKKMEMYYNFLYNEKNIFTQELENEKE